MQIPRPLYRCSSAAEDAKTERDTDPDPDPDPDSDPDPDPDPGPDSDTDPDSDAHQRQKMQKVTFGICQRAISADWTDIYL